MRKFILLVLVAQVLLGFMTLTTWGRQIPQVAAGASSLIREPDVAHGPRTKDQKPGISAGFRFGNSNNNNDNDNNSNSNSSSNNTCEDNDNDSDNNNNNYRRGPPGRGPPRFGRGRQDNNNNNNNNNNSGSS